MTPLYASVNDRGSKLGAEITQSMESRWKTPQGKRRTERRWVKETGTEYEGKITVNEQQWRTETESIEQFCWGQMKNSFLCLSQLVMLQCAVCDLLTIWPLFSPLRRKLKRLFTPGTVYFTVTYYSSSMKKNLQCFGLRTDYGFLLIWQNITENELKNLYIRISPENNNGINKWLFREMKGLPVLHLVGPSEQRLGQTPLVQYDSNVPGKHTHTDTQAHKDTTHTHRRG